MAVEEVVCLGGVSAEGSAVERRYLLECCFGNLEASRAIDLSVALLVLPLACVLSGSCGLVDDPSRDDADNSTYV